MDSSIELQNRIIEKLKTVIDPETNIDVISMGLIKDLKVDPEPGLVNLKFRPSVSMCPLGFKLAFDIRDAVKDVEGVRKVKLEVIDFVYSLEVNRMLSEENQKEKQK